MKDKVPNRIRYGAVTDRGLVRTRNEDAFAVDRDYGLMVVSDGVGGSGHGAVASEIVVRMLPQMVANRLRGLSVENDVAIRTALRSAVADLSDQLHAKINGCSGVRGMGATVVAVLIRGSQAHVAHMGDSRAYLMHDGRLARITNDHSVAGILERCQELSPQQARDHAARGHLTRFVGMPIPALPDVCTVIVQDRDRVLLCTDGLTGGVAEDDMAAILCETIDPQQACQRLLDAALAAGGDDNVTAVVVDGYEQSCA